MEQLPFTLTFSRTDHLNLYPLDSNIISGRPAPKPGIARRRARPRRPEIRSSTESAEHRYGLHTVRGVVRAVVAKVIQFDPPLLLVAEFVPSLRVRAVLNISLTIAAQVVVIANGAFLRGGGGDGEAGE